MSRTCEQMVRQHSTAKGDLRDAMAYIAGFMHNTTGEFFQSIKTTAAGLGVSERTAQYRLRQLVDLGELASHPKGGWNGTTVYVLGPVYEGVQESAPYSILSTNTTTSQEEVLNTRSNRVQEFAPATDGGANTITCTRCGGWYLEEHDLADGIPGDCRAHAERTTLTPDAPKPA